MTLRVDWEELDILDDYRNTYEGMPFTGIAFELDDQGRLIAEDSMVNGILNGLSHEYYPSGRLKAESMLKDGGYHGLYVEWYENGQFKAQRTYERGHLLTERLFDEEGNLTRDYIKSFISPQTNMKPDSWDGKTIGY